jgi:DNA-directed RNA polymerase specialized sigma24 family protein
MQVVRVHADRVHDGVRRLGCDPVAAVEVVEESALDLVDAVASRPQTVEDAVGWWFARARALGRKVVSRSADLPLGGGVLAVDDDQQVLAEALDQLPEASRWALLLRDSYDLPATSVGAALGVDADTAMELVARARLEFLPLVDDEPAPPVPTHQGSLGSLARIAEGGPVAAEDAAARRHALSCESCRMLTDGLQRAHLLLTGVAVAALPADERSALLGRVEDAAYAALPTAAALQAEQEAWLLEEDDDEPPRLFSPLLVLLSLVLAVLLGIGAGLVLSRAGGVGALVGGGGTAPEDVVLLQPPSPPPQPLVSPPPVVQPLPRTTVFLVPPPQPSPPPPSPRPSPTAQPLTLTVDPEAGPDGATLSVSGTGWTPGATVLLEYLDPTGTPTGSESTVTVASDGTFTGTLVAEDPNDLPGEHVVRASDGEVQAEATYDASP